MTKSKKVKEVDGSTGGRGRSRVPNWIDSLDIVMFALMRQ